MLMRRYLAGGKIIDRNHIRDRLLRHLQFRDFRGVDQTAPVRLLEVGDTGVTQLIADRLRCGEQCKCPFEASEPIAVGTAEEPDGQAVAGGRRFEQNLGAGSRQSVGRSVAARPKGLNEET